MAIASEFDLIDPEIKRFSDDFNIRLVLGHKDYDLQLLVLGLLRIQLDPPNNQGIVMIHVANAVETKVLSATPATLYSTLKSIIQANGTTST